MMSNQFERVLVHVPHASDHIPATARQHFKIDEEALQRELLALTDWYTDDLFAVDSQPGIAIRFPVSRFVVDPERLADDSQEPMADRGMGVVYTHRSDGIPYRIGLSAAERDLLLTTYYWPHWQRIEKEVDRRLAMHDHCLIIDAHSFPNEPLPVHEAQYSDGTTADICLGTDDFHTPTALIDVARASFTQFDLSVSVNTPFKGTIVPLKHLKVDNRVHSIMIEVNRRLYMDELTGARSSGYPRTKEAVQSALIALMDAKP
jgi:N-formylglutamate amidohydrolase